MRPFVYNNRVICCQAFLLADRLHGNRTEEHRRECLCQVLVRRRSLEVRPWKETQEWPIPSWVRAS
jgi:hypothetical protein